MQWIMTHYQEILLGATSVIGAASILVLSISKLTKNTKDDVAATWLIKVAKLLKRLSLNVK